MIKKSMPLTLAEVVKLAGDSEKETKIKAFAKQFVKISAEEAQKMREELRQLDLIKLKEEHLVMIAEFTPQDMADLSKILSGVSLNQDEVDKILGVVKKY